MTQSKTVIILEKAFQTIIFSSQFTAYFSFRSNMQRLVGHFISFALCKNITNLIDTFLLFQCGDKC